MFDLHTHSSFESQTLGYCIVLHRRSNSVLLDGHDWLGPLLLVLVLGLQPVHYRLGRTSVVWLVL